MYSAQVHQNAFLYLRAKQILLFLLHQVLVQLLIQQVPCKFLLLENTGQHVSLTHIRLLRLIRAGLPPLEHLSNVPASSFVESIEWQYSVHQIPVQPPT